MNKNNNWECESASFGRIGDDEEIQCVSFHVVMPDPVITKQYCDMVAAAPDLLKALKSLVEKIRSDGDFDFSASTFDALEKADEAIEKAGG